jgi:tRNA1(Val) A37 N6-methylase TrmN6
MAQYPSIRVVGLDCDPYLVELACANASLNGWEPRYTGWAEALEDVRPTELFDYAVMNPPYHATERGHNPTSPAKRKAKSLLPGKLEVWLTKVGSLLTASGILDMVIHTACVPEVSAICDEHSWAHKIYPTPTAKRKLVRIVYSTT